MLKPKYLTCDPPNEAEGVTYYTLVGLGEEPIEVPRSTGDETCGFKFYLTDIPVGTYTVRAMACNEWTCSLESNSVNFTKLAAPSPPELRLG